MPLSFSYLQTSAQRRVYTSHSMTRDNDLLIGALLKALSQDEEVLYELGVANLALLDALKEHLGEDFEQLFRKHVDLVKGSEAMRAAADRVAVLQEQSRQFDELILRGPEK
jgi:hypothetical protein